MLRSSGPFSAPPRPLAPTQVARRRNLGGRPNSCPAASSCSSRSATTDQFLLAAVRTRRRRGLASSRPPSSLPAPSRHPRLLERPFARPLQSRGHRFTPAWGVYVNPDLSSSPTPKEVTRRGAGRSGHRESEGRLKALPRGIDVLWDHRPAVPWGVAGLGSRGRVAWPSLMDFEVDLASRRLSGLRGGCARHRLRR